MAITITFDKLVQLGGGIKIVFFTLVQSGATAGSLAVGSYLNHIYWANVRDITTDIAVNATWTDGSETITVEDQGSTGDTLKVIVIGT